MDSSGLRWLRFDGGSYNLVSTGLGRHLVRSDLLASLVQQTVTMPDLGVPVCKAWWWSIHFSAPPPLPPQHAPLVQNKTRFGNSQQRPFEACSPTHQLSHDRGVTRLAPFFLRLNNGCTGCSGLTYIDIHAVTRPDSSTS
jgi:hypothetical protein